MIQCANQITGSESLFSVITSLSNNFKILKLSVSCVAKKWTSVLFLKY